MDLVRPDDFSLPSRHYYYHERERFDLSLAELAEVGVVDGSCRVDRALIPSLQLAQAEFARRGYALVIKDGYRSPELYRLVHRKRLVRYGREHTERLLNIERMIHASGRVVDIDITALDGSKLAFRAAEDGILAHLYGYYQNKADSQSLEFQHNQDLLKNVMFPLGFVFGTLVEYWHFELLEVA